jgi:PKD repeat protein
MFNHDDIMDRIHFSNQGFICILTILLVVGIPLYFFQSTDSVVMAELSENLAPVANPHLDTIKHPISNSVKVLEQVYFVGIDSYDPNPADNITYHWDFGDGSTSSQVSPTHIYRQIGEYHVTLTVSDSNLSDSQTIVIIVISEGEHIPIPIIILDAQNDEAGNYHANISEPILFDASGSYDPDGFLLNYEWDFGDGVKSHQGIPTHKYKESGIYTVSLYVTDEDLLPNYDSVTIIIGTGKTSDSNDNNPDEAISGTAYLLIALAVVAVLVIVILWLYLRRVRKRMGLPSTTQPDQMVTLSKPKTTPAMPEFGRPEVRSQEKTSRRARLDQLSKNEVKIKQLMLRRKLQEERKKVDDDMRKELEELGIKM